MDGPEEKTTADRPSAEGHRARLKSKLLSAHGEGLLDYELLEILLFLALPRRDVRPLARDLLTRFSSFSALFAAPPEVLTKIPGMGEGVVATLKTINLIAARLGREEMRRAPLMTHPRALEHYCTLTMGTLGYEQLRVFYLDAAGQLILDVVHQTGGPHAVAADVRPILKEALQVDAVQLILVHNHPSGDPTPSEMDIAFTKHVQRAATTLDLYLHDHLILGHQGLFSLRAAGFLGT